MNCCYYFNCAGAVGHALDHASGEAGDHPNVIRSPTSCNSSANMRQHSFIWSAKDRYDMFILNLSWGYRAFSKPIILMSLLHIKLLLLKLARQKWT